VAGRRSVPRPSRTALSPSSILPAEGTGNAGSYTVPKLNKDPVSSMALCPTTVRIADKSIEVPAYAAVEWLHYLMRPTPDFDGIFTDLIPEIEDIFYEDERPLEGMYQLCLEIIETVSAHPWWVTFRLIGVAQHHWDTLGPELMFHGVDASQISLGAWLDAVLVLILRNMDPKHITMFTMQLEIAPTTGLFAPEPDPNADPNELPQLETSRDVFLSMGD